MDEFAGIAQLIRTIAKGSKANSVVGGGAFFVADVVSVEGQTCTVDYNGFKMDDVRLTAIVSESETGMLIKPKVGSKVLLASIDGSIENLYVLKAQEFDTVLMQTTQTVFTQDNEGFLLKKGEQSLRGLLLDIVSLIQNLKVVTPSGASTNLITPTPADLISVETRIKSLLKD